MTEVKSFVIDKLSMEGLEASKANGGGGGADSVSRKDFAVDLQDILYKILNCIQSVSS